MHSSISNFERTVPGGRWGATWLVVVIVVIAVVVRLELFIRARGYQPSVTDDEYAWAWQRARVADHSPRTMALLGSSRIILGFSPSAFRETLPDWRYAQLGVLASTPIGALQDLARDPAFVGVAIVEVSDYAFYQLSWIAQDRQIATYHRRWRAIGAMTERVLANEVQSRLAVLAMRAKTAISKLLSTGTWPKPPHVVTYPDRTRFADFTLTDLASQRGSRIADYETWEQTSRDPVPWLADAMRIEPAIAQIQARGGQVVYLRMPTCDERWDADERMFPKAQFWDVLATRTRAIAIHFKDHPTLSKLACPDTSHIDGRDAPELTRALLAILRDRGVLTR